MVQQYKHTRTLAKRIKKPLFGKYSKIFHFSPNSKPDVKSKPNPNLYLTKEDPELKRFNLVNQALTPFTGRYRNYGHGA